MNVSESNTNREVKRNTNREVRKRHWEGMAVHKAYQTSNHYRQLELNMGHQVSYPRPREPQWPELGMEKPPSLRY